MSKEKELEIPWAWLMGLDLLTSANSEELAPNQAIHKFGALSKYHFGESIGTANWLAILQCLVQCKYMLKVV